MVVSLNCRTPKTLISSTFSQNATPIQQKTISIARYALKGIVPPLKKFAAVSLMLAKGVTAQNLGNSTFSSTDYTIFGSVGIVVLLGGMVLALFICIKCEDRFKNPALQLEPREVPPPPLILIHPDGTIAVLKPIENSG